MNSPKSPTANIASGGTVTRGEQMLALRHHREATSHPFFRGGFRPFFLAGPIWAVVALALWLCSLSGEISLPTVINALSWHRHEMLFGFVGAAVAGFLLTAIPNWTGRLPIAGTPLAALFGAWVAGRVALLGSATFGLGVAALLDIGFFVILAVVAGREVLMSANRRNFPVVGMVLAFALADGLDYLGFAGIVPEDLGWRAALAVIVTLISLIGGRIVPSFTRNWLGKRKLKTRLPTQPDGFDALTQLVSGAALLAWLVVDGDLVGIFLLVAAGLQIVRLARWRGLQAWPEPILFILHVGYAWIPVGLALLGLASLGEIARSAAVHAITAGAMTTMILAVMSRASLGHTARELKAAPLVVLAYALVTLGALLRVGASLQWLPYETTLRLGGGAWGGALLLYAIVYAPILWKPRLTD